MKTKKTNKPLSPAVSDVIRAHAKAQRRADKLSDLVAEHWDETTQTALPLSKKLARKSEKAEFRANTARRVKELAMQAETEFVKSGYSPYESPFPVS